MIGLAAAELRGFDLPIAVHIARGHDAESDVRGIKPMVRDRRLGRIHRRHAVHERGRAKGRLAGKPRINKQGLACVEPMRVGGRKLHEKIVRMLAIHQRRCAVGAFARRQQQRIAIGAHERIGRQHGP